MRITSTKFNNNETIPIKYTCKGENINPDLEFEDIPEGTKSLVLIVDDPDAPGGTWTHWTMWNIPPNTKTISENSVPEGAVQGVNSSGNAGYAGPCPPSGTHHYHFKLYALDKILDLPTDTAKGQLGQTIVNHFIAQAELLGTCSHE